MPSLIQTLTTVTVNYNKLRTVTTKLQTITKKKLTDNYNKLQTITSNIQTITTIIVRTLTIEVLTLTTM